MNKGKDLGLLEDKGHNIVLFYPHVPESAIRDVQKVMSTRWIGQGPKVDEFETEFSKKFAKGYGTVAVGSGTDALHLAYILAGISPGDEVITTVFTCTATNIPLLYMGANIRFADIQKNTLNIDPLHVKKLVNKKTKAIVCVHYGGLPCDMNELHEIANDYGIPVIEDAAQAIGAKYKGKTIGSISEFTCFSFQAIKTLTTGDGGMLVIKDKKLLDKAQRIRWFGIDRKAKQKGVWENDIKEIGYKYQMTDIAAAIGLAGLKEFDNTFAYRRKLFQAYSEGLRNIPGITFIEGNTKDRLHAAWICTVLAENRFELQLKLRRHKIESNQVHFRNDRYSIFKNFKTHLPVMDQVEDKYLVLPLHMKITESDVDKICRIIKSGW